MGKITWRKTLTIIIFILAVCLFFTQSGICQEGFYPARVKDISDRAYEKAVIELLDNAGQSIVISMYIMKPGDFAKYTINRLLKAYLKEEGKDIEDYSKSELSRMFGISRFSIREGIR